MERPTAIIVGVGEILWDLLPQGRQLGGAPFNFAFHCHQLGNSSLIVSRVGDDELGRDIRAHLAALGLSDTYVQHDAGNPTGTVAVEIDARGQPSFTITPDVAYDHLMWDTYLEALFPKVRAICFGTLVQRHPSARATIARALHSAEQALIVYDINLRQHFYSREVIETSLHASRWLKLNTDELTVLQELLKLRAAAPSACLAELRRRYELELVCLTRGEDGCLVQTASEEVDLPGRRVQVVDTIGAGDAFTAGLLTATLEGQSLATAADFANRLAARVAAAPGGTPIIDRANL
jgi:fructokinase